MVDLVVQLDGVPVRVTGVEHSHDIVHVAHRHGERAGREVADALRVQDAEQSAEFARCWNPATFSVVSTMEPAYIHSVFYFRAKLWKSMARPDKV